MLSRIVDFDSGELLINDVDVRRYEPAELHRATTAVFQSFCKYNGTVAENVGVGYIHDLDCPAALRKAVQLAEGDHIVRSLPHGINTRLDALGLDSMSYSPAGVGACGARAPWASHGLSGGEVRSLSCNKASLLIHVFSGNVSPSLVHSCAPTSQKFISFSLMNPCVLRPFPPILIITP